MMTDIQTQTMPTSIHMPMHVSNSKKRPRPSPVHVTKRKVTPPIIDHAKECRVVVHDLLAHPPIISNDTMNEVSELKQRISKLEALLTPLLPLTALTNMSTSNDHSLLLEAAGLIDALSTEIEQRLCCRRQVIIYNVPDRIPSEKAKQAILMAAGLTGADCRCTRLRKASPLLCCPLLLELPDEASTKTLLQHQDSLQCHPLLSSAKVTLAQTPLQRELKKRKAFQPKCSSTTATCHAAGAAQNRAQRNSSTPYHVVSASEYSSASSQGSDTCNTAVPDITSFPSLSCSAALSTITADHLEIQPLRSLPISAEGANKHTISSIAPSASHCSETYTFTYDRPILSHPTPRFTSLRGGGKNRRPTTRNPMDTNRLMAATTNVSLCNEIMYLNNNTVSAISAPTSPTQVISDQHCNDSNIVHLAEQSSNLPFQDSSPLPDSDCSAPSSSNQQTSPTAYLTCRTDASYDNSVRPISSTVSTSHACTKMLSMNNARCNQALLPTPKLPYKKASNRRPPSLNMHAKPTVRRFQQPNVDISTMPMRSNHWSSRNLLKFPPSSSSVNSFLPLSTAVPSHSHCWSPLPFHMAASLPHSPPLKPISPLCTQQPNQQLSATALQLILHLLPFVHAPTF